MAEQQAPLKIKRYASRRLYNTETSDYVTLEDIAEAIRGGREVQIIDLKSGDDLTRQYLLQIIAEHESRGENMLPVNVLTDMVRSYANQAQSMMPDFLAAAFEAYREGQASWMEQMTKANPLAKMPGMEAMRAQQQAFLKAWANPMAAADASGQGDTPEDLSEIREQLARLQEKLSRLDD